MKKLRTPLKILGGIVALLIVLALAAPMFISSDLLKDQLVAQVKKTTGRTLEIKGATSVTFLPNIAVSAEDVTLSNPEGYTTPYLIHMDKLATGAALMPLLHGQLIITGITLDKPSVNLEELSSGAKNWEFTAEKIQDSAEVKVENEATKAKSSPLKSFALGDVKINDGVVNIVKPKANVMAINNIDLTLSGADAHSPLKLEGSAEYKQEDVNMAIDIAQTKSFMNGESSPIVVSLKLPGGALDFTGTAEMKDKPAAKGKLSASLSSLPKVLAWASGSKPSSSMPEQVTIKSDIDLKNDVVTLANASFHADDTQATGALAIDLGKKKPAISGNLKLGDIDLDKLLKKKSSSTSAADAGEKSSQSEGWSSEKVDVSALNAANADLEFAFDKLKSGKFELGATRGHGEINAGKLTLNIFETKLYDGSGAGIVYINPDSVGANLGATSVDIDKLVTALAGKSRLRGKGNVKVNIWGSGNSQREWVETLGGNGTIALRDGAIKGINIGQFLRNAKQGFLFKSESESTDFTELGGTFTIDKGVLTNKDLAMKSPALRLSGEGSANMPAKSINYRLEPTIAGTSKGQGGKDDVGGLTIPLVITGPWSNPSVTPDLAGMLQDGLKNPEKLKENIQGIKDTIGDFNSGDDLKRALLGGGKKEAAPAAVAPTTGDTAPAATTSAPAPAPAKSKEDAIKEGIGGLLKGL
jgi:AsmA protein